MFYSYLLIGIYFAIYRYSLKLQAETTGISSKEYKSLRTIMGTCLSVMFLGVTLVGLI